MATIKSAFFQLFFRYQVRVSKLRHNCYATSCINLFKTTLETNRFAIDLPKILFNSEAVPFLFFVKKRPKHRVVVGICRQKSHAHNSGFHFQRQEKFPGAQPMGTRVPQGALGRGGVLAQQSEPRLAPGLGLFFVLRFACKLVGSCTRSVPCASSPEIVI